MAKIAFPPSPLAAAVLFAAALLPLSSLANQPDWPADVQFMLPEFADSGCVPCNYCDACGFGGGRCDCGCGCGCGYCYCGPCCTDGLMNGFLATAERMAACGVTYAPSVTQFYQGVTDGGNDRGFEYGGKVDQFLILDSCKLGLWDGMTMTMHVETRFGQDVNREAVGMAPVNVAMLYPNPDEHDTAITNLTFAQAISDDVQLTFGKFNALDMFYGLYPETGRGVNTFMNASIALPLAVARVTPLAFMGAGVIKTHEGKPQGGLLVYDTHNVSTTNGFDELFDNGANIMAYWRFFTNHGGLPGSHFFGGIASTGDFFAADPAGFVIIPGQGIVSPRQEGSWAAIYILQQALWADCCNPSRNVSVLSAWSIADEETCPFAWTGNVAVQAHGLNRSRPHDTLGVGYFYSGLSSDFQNLLDPLVELDDVHGAEVFYNMAVTKFLQVTADLQVIEPAEVDNDTAIVFGLRAYMGM